MRLRGDGDGWVQCAAGHRHWGRYGAAGLLLTRDGEALLQHRVEWSHEGGTWGVPGGARTSTEDPVSAAVREAAEEAGVQPALVAPTAVYVEDHGGWSYSTVLAEPTGWFDARATDPESLAVRWVPLDDVPLLPLHSGLAGAWADLVGLVGRRLLLVVDVANVMGSTPDGWWRDRAAAAQRVLARLEPLAAGVPASATGLVGVPVRLSRWLPELVAVVEGQARDVGAPDGAVRVERARRSGDDEVVAQVELRRGERPGDPVLVVTADRGLAARVEALGAQVAGPSVLARLARSG